MRDLGKIRAAVEKVAEAGRSSVGVVRDSFASGAPPFQTTGSGSVANYLDTFTDDELGTKLIRGTSRLGLSTSPGGTTVQPARPELDSVSIVEDRNRGVLDQFTAQLTVSVRALDASRAGTIRIFRSSTGRAKLPRATVAALMSAPESAGKGADVLLPTAQRAAELGVGNIVTSFISDSPSGGRSVTSPAAQQLSPALPPLNTNRTTRTPSGLVSIEGADRAVVESLSFYLNRRSVGAVPTPARGPIQPGRVSGLNVLRGGGISTGGVVQESNGTDFISIGNVSPSGPEARTVGDVVEMTFVDPTVVYGATYSYYVAAVGPSGEIGPRSRIVPVTVARSVPPGAPDVTYGLVGGVPRFVLRCSPGTSHVEVFRAGRAALRATSLGSGESLIVEGPSNKVGDFYHTGDLGLGPDGSTVLVDKDVIPGDRPSYRFYSVDPYGLKSQTPFSCSLLIPAPGDRVPLGIPSITTEQTGGSRPSIRVVATIDDPRVVGFMFARRDITVGERALHQANQPELVTLGRTDAKRAGSRRGPTPMDLPWPSVVMAPVGSASFVDTSVRPDRVYQYSVQAVDRKGNKSYQVAAQPLGVYSKATVDPPTDLQATTVVDGADPRGVLLTWTGGTLDFSPNQLLDDQDVLAATSVRSVFQVERRQRGSSFWEAMPATTESYFVDPVLPGQTPEFRPEYPTKGSEYEYRVLAMQSGGFISPRTDPVSVLVAPPPPSPSTVWVRSTSLAVRPLRVVVSWNMPSEFIVSWEVQRASVNKLYGARIGSMDSKLARGLQYLPIASVTPEASRALGLQADGALDLDPAIYVGGRFFVDVDVDPANSYFYRVRSVGRSGIVSDWSYGGVSLSDHAFDRKMMSVLSDDDRISLAADPRPVRMKGIL